MAAAIADDTAPATKSDIALILARFDDMDKHFSAHNARFTAHDERFTAHDARFTAHDERFDMIDKQFATVLEFIERSALDTRQYIDEAVDRISQELYNKTTDQDVVINRHEKRIRTVERKLGIAA